jgi:hypothetical protein
MRHNFCFSVLFILEQMHPEGSHHDSPLIRLYTQRERKRERGNKIIANKMNKGKKYNYARYGSISL